MNQQSRSFRSKGAGVEIPVIREIQVIADCMNSTSCWCDLHPQRSVGGTISGMHRWHDTCDSSETMKTCHHCGNTYDKCFDITIGGRTYTFDSFECALHTVAPVCDCCGCRILGHGVEAEGKIYCCAHCARAEGVNGLVDNADNA